MIGLGEGGSPTHPSHRRTVIIRSRPRGLYDRGRRRGVTYPSDLSLGGVRCLSEDMYIRGFVCIYVRGYICGTRPRGLYDRARRRGATYPSEMNPWLPIGVRTSRPTNVLCLCCCQMQETGERERESERESESESESGSVRGK